MKEDEIVMILNVQSSFVLEYFVEGKQAKDKDENPYIKGTNAFYNWNKGYNER